MNNKNYIETERGGVEWGGMRMDASNIHEDGSDFKDYTSIVKQDR